jgi:hypothetical protein
MDLNKQRKFNEKMGRPKYSKGGYIKKIANRKYFDDGGDVSSGSAVGGATNLTNTNTQGIGGISTALGLNAQSANITPGTNTSQLNSAYTNAQSGLGQQQGIVNTVVPGVQTGVNAQNQIENQELAMTQGAGPNPAQAQLSQATGTNVNNEAALLAGQRGASGNVGLAARNIGQQGANTEQQAVGQAATMEAQQQIAAQQNAANIAAQQVGQAQGATTALNTGEQNEQNILQNANTSANNAATGMQSNINSVNSSANQGILGGIGSGVSALTGGLFSEGGKVSPHGKHKLEFVHKMAKMGLEHFDDGGDVYNQSQPSSGPEIQAPPQSSKGSSPLAELAPIAAAFMADGGQIQANPLIAGIVNSPGSLNSQSPGYSSSSATNGPNVPGAPSASSSNGLGQSISSGYKSGQQWKAKQAAQNNPMNNSQNLQASDDSEFGGSQIGDNVDVDPDTVFSAKGGEIWNIHPSQHAEYAAKHFANYFSKGGESKDVPAMVSPGERYLNPDEVKMVQHGADPTKLGHIFPGKAKVKGDSLKNDNIPATLKEGGVVIDREHMGHPDKEKLFVLKSMRATGKHKPTHMKKPGVN